MQEGFTSVSSGQESPGERRGSSGSAHMLASSNKGVHEDCWDHMDGFASTAERGEAVTDKPQRRNALQGGSSGTEEQIQNNLRLRSGSGGDGLW